MKIINYWGLLFLLLQVNNSSVCSDGLLDPTFNNPIPLPGAPAGTLTTPSFGVVTDAALGQAIVLQTDQKIVAVGIVSINGVTGFAVARYNTDGSLDAVNFGAFSDVPGTVVITSFGPGTDYVQAASVAMQTDGKIVVVGTVTISGLEQFGIVRLNTDGSLDTTFGASSPEPGTVLTPSFTLDPADTFSSGATSVVITSSGSIVVVGAATTNTTSFAVAVYDTDGNLDPSFGASSDVPGTVLTSAFTDPATDTNTASATAVAVQANGKIVVVGSVNTNPTGTEQFGIARYDTDGALDITFSAGSPVPGTVLIPSFVADPANMASSSAAAVTIQPNGYIVVVGHAEIIDPMTSDSLTQFALARFDTDGELDITFGALSPVPGTVTTNTFGTVNIGSFARGVALQDDGKIVVVGAAIILVRFTLLNDLVLARYTSAGILDPTFGVMSTVPGTVVTYSFGTGTVQTSASGVVIQADDKIVVVGTVVMDPSTPQLQFALARYNSFDTFVIIDTPLVGARLTNRMPTIAGTTEIGNTVEVFIDSVSIGFAAVDGAGNWTINVPSPLALGVHFPAARAINTHGNTVTAISVFVIIATQALSEAISDKYPC